MNPTSEQINHIGRSIQVDAEVVKRLDELGLSREMVAAFYGMSLELWDSIFDKDGVASKDYCLD